MLTELKKGGYIPENPAVAEIGAQQLAPRFHEAEEELAKLQALYGAQSAYTDVKEPPRLHGNAGNSLHTAPATREFWRWLGFRYAAIDIDGSEDSIALDLNVDSIAPEHTGKFHITTNFGTTEHIANQLNAFKVIHELTAPGGVMIHNLPAQGMHNHGLVNYNPKFFWNLARSNGYSVLSANYRSSGEYKPLPQNIIDMVTPFDASIVQRVEHYKTADCSVIFMLQKSYDIPFVPPIDVPMGTQTTNEALRKRYWTVFNENAFAHYRKY